MAASEEAKAVNKSSLSLIPSTMPRVLGIQLERSPALGISPLIGLVGGNGGVHVDQSSRPTNRPAHNRVALCLRPPHGTHYLKSLMGYIQGEERRI